MHSIEWMLNSESDFFILNFGDEHFDTLKPEKRSLKSYFCTHSQTKLNRKYNKKAHDQTFSDINGCTMYMAS